MFYLCKDNYLVTLNQFDSQSGWGELLVERVSFSRQPVISGLYRLKPVATVWFHLNGSICFYFSRDLFLEDPTTLIIDILHELYRNGIKNHAVAYESFPPPKADIVSHLNSKTYAKISLKFRN